MWAIKQLTSHDQISLLRDARDYALLNGSVLRYGYMSNDNCVAHLPFTLFPSPFPNKLYQECLELQPTINRLMLSIANDFEYINEILGPIGTVDKFTQELLSVENKIRLEGRAQPIMSCISRSDYMLHKTSHATRNLESIQARQVEVNAIASSMSAHSFNIGSTHEFLMSKYNIVTDEGTKIPQNDSLDLVANGLIDAFDAYGKDSAHLYVLTVNEPRSANFSDQLRIEIEVHRHRPDIRFIRRRFDLLPTLLKLGPNKELLLEESKEIAVVYFRYGYDPTNYAFENSWATRLLLERSKAIKCPSINFHLSGAKKFQQVLNNREQLERYLNAEEANRLEKLFCKLWSIETETGEGFRLATTASENKLVLKPQREGGGHNIFADDIKPFVQKLVSREDRSQYILMEYINGPLEQNLLLLYDDKPELEATRMSSCDQLVSELGIYGSILADNNSRIFSNRAAGYLVRSKKFGINEGGVAAGYAGISSLLLLPEDLVDSSKYFVEQ